MANDYKKWLPAGKIFGEAVEKTTYPDEISTFISDRI